MVEGKISDHLPYFILQEVNVDPGLVRAVPVVAHLLGPGRPRLALAALAAVSCGLVLGPDPRQQHTQQQQHPALAAGYIKEEIAAGKEALKK